jgi:hypothetical protein
LALRAAARRLDVRSKNRIEQSKRRPKSGQSSHFTKPFDPVSGRRQLLNPVTCDTTAERCGRADEGESP